MKWLIAALMATLALALAPDPAEAKRFGGGGSFGTKRSAPPPQRTPDNAQPAQSPTTAPGAPANAAAPVAAGGAKAAAGGRSWLAPVAGLAAGLGLVALMSHLGLGEEMANFVMLAGLALLAVLALRLLMRRFAGAPAPRPVLAGAAQSHDAGMARRSETAGPLAAVPTPHAAPAFGAAAAPVPGPAVPSDFDSAGFERVAKAIFIRMQAANDAADLNDLRQFTTPEVFAELRLQLQERGPGAQHTDVVDVHAEVIEVAEEDGQQIVSVRYHGELIEQAGEPAQAFDEVWHLARPVDDSRAWAIAGVQQRLAA
jgi:predicted lipid-binding transport protein (Tim44 family)